MPAVRPNKIEMIPISRITVLNPRARNKRQHLEIVNNIEAIGLKRPITVSRRDGEPGIRLVHVGYLGDELAGRRVQDLEPASAPGLAPAAIHIGKGFDQGECGL